MKASAGTTPNINVKTPREAHATRQLVAEMMTCTIGGKMIRLILSPMTTHAMA